MLSNLLKKASVAALALSTAVSAYSTCVVPFGGPGVDDSVAVRSLLANCSTNAEIVFSSCTTYNISTPINFGTLNNVTVSILGNLNLPQSIPYIQSLVNVTGSLYWFTFKVSCNPSLELDSQTKYNRAQTLLSRATKIPQKVSSTRTASNGGQQRNTSLPSAVSPCVPMASASTSIKQQSDT